MLIFQLVPTGSPDVVMTEEDDRLCDALLKIGHDVVWGDMRSYSSDGTPHERYDVIRRADAIVVRECPEHMDHFAVDDVLGFAENHGIPIHRIKDGDELPGLHRTETTSPVQCAAFLDTVMAGYRLHLAKNGDYSSSNILGTGEIGLVTRVWDKMARIFSLSGFDVWSEFRGYTGPRAAANESLDDSWSDLWVYGVIAKLYRAGKWGR